MPDFQELPEPTLTLMAPPELPSARESVATDVQEPLRPTHAESSQQAAPSAQLAESLDNPTSSCTSPKLQEWTTNAMVCHSRELRPSSACHRA
jgi:hypothetical protein